MKKKTKNRNTADPYEYYPPPLVFLLNVSECATEHYNPTIRRVLDYLKLPELTETQIEAIKPLVTEIGIFCGPHPTKCFSFESFEKFFDTFAPSELQEEFCKAMSVCGMSG
jgi:hypothetical protein